MLNACVNFFDGALQPSELIFHSSVWHKPFLFSFEFLKPCFSPHVLMYLLFTRSKLFAVLQNDLTSLLSLYVALPGSFLSPPLLPFFFFLFLSPIWVNHIFSGQLEPPPHTAIITLSVLTCNWLNCLHLSLDRSYLNTRAVYFLSIYLVLVQCLAHSVDSLSAQMCSQTCILNISHLSPPFSLHCHHLNLVPVAHLESQHNLCHHCV